MISTGYPPASAPPQAASRARRQRVGWTIISAPSVEGTGVASPSPPGPAITPVRTLVGTRAGGRGALVGHQGSAISPRFLRLFATGVSQNKRLAPKTHTAKWTMAEQQASAEQLATREPRHRPVSCPMGARVFRGLDGSPEPRGLTTRRRLRTVGPAARPRTPPSWWRGAAPVPAGRPVTVTAAGQRIVMRTWRLGGTEVVVAVSGSPSPCQPAPRACPVGAWRDRCGWGSRACTASTARHQNWWRHRSRQPTSPRSQPGCHLPDGALPAGGTPAGGRAPGRIGPGGPCGRRTLRSGLPRPRLPSIRRPRRAAALRAFSLAYAVTQRNADDRHYPVFAADSARPS